MKSPFRKPRFYEILAVFVLGVLILNSWLSSRINTMKQADLPQAGKSAAGLPLPAGQTDGASVEAPPPVVLMAGDSDQPTGVYHRNVMIDPGRKFMRNAILNGGREVALFKSDGERIFDVVGRIPDGLVAFTDEYAGTSGEEHFLNGLRHGDYLERYPDGQVRRRKVYDRGEVRSLYVTGDIQINASLLTTGSQSYPEASIMGFMTPNTISMDLPGATIMAILYAESAIYLYKNMTIMGSIVSDYVDMGTNVPSIYHVPAIVDNLPPGMIGADAIIGVDIVSWSQTR